MSIFTTHPRSRWAVPAVAVVAIGGITLTASMSADASTPLAARSAAQLLADVSQAKLTGLSGTVVQTSDLGIPSIPGVSTGSGSGASSDLTSLVSGTHTLRVWYGGTGQERIALLGSLGESDVVRNGSDLWIWSSQAKTAKHYTLPTSGGAKAGAKAGAKTGAKTGVKTDATAGPHAPAENLTPDQAAKQALAAINPSTVVTTAGTANVAGRPAYELVLKPRDAASLVTQVRIAIDAKTRIPLRVQVYSAKLKTPAFEVGFSQVSFAKPEARQFTFNAPPGTTVTQESAKAPTNGTASSKPKPGAVAKAAGEPKVMGTGWTSVVVATLPADAMSSAAKGQDSGSLSQLDRVLTSLPRVSGSWGTGRLFSGTLVSVVLTDNGRVAIGAVTPDRLYAALAAK